MWVSGQFKLYLQNVIDILFIWALFVEFFIIIYLGEENMANKRIWTNQEDNFLRQETNNNQHKNWVKISTKLNQKFGGDLRSPKQCRQRYINHASTPKEQPFSNEWSQSDTKTLFQLYEFYGPRWTTIAHEMLNKSENIVKNKFYCSLRKFTRKLNKFLKSGKNKYKKQIRYESLIRIMDAYDSYLQMPEHFKNWSREIRKKILGLTLVTISDGQIKDEALEWVTQNVNKFNLQTRSYKPKKPHCEGPQRSSATVSSKTESWRNSSESEEYIFVQNNKGSEQILQEKNIECEQILKNGIIKQQKTSEQNYKFDEIMRQENMSKQELMQDFGTGADLNADKERNCQKDIYFEVFSQEFPRFQIDDFLL